MLTVRGIAAYNFHLLETTELLCYGDFNWNFRNLKLELYYSNSELNIIRKLFYIPWNYI